MADQWSERRANQPARENDIRNEYQRDHARLVHSSAFRRLQAKTQVLGLGESDFYRTRLTHSMEVAQIGTGINAFLQEKYGGEGGNAEIYENLPRRALINTICLAHDIGHPPFGHGGEVALNYCMDGYGGFEGNAQTLRILSKLEKYISGCGLNPTRRTLLGVLKYPSPFSKTNGMEESRSGGDSHEWLFKGSEKKPPKCYFDCDKEVVDWILRYFESDEINAFTEAHGQRGKKHKKPKRKGLDTSIMDLADDISYAVHDLEDAIALRLIGPNQWDDFLQKEGKGSVFDRFKDLRQKLFFKDSACRKDTIGRLVNFLITNVYVEEVDEPTFKNPMLRYNARLSSEAEPVCETLQEMVKNYVILDENVQQLEFKGQKLVVELFNVLATDPLRFLPKSTKEKYEQAGHDLRVVCDYVAGMTDDYATRMYEKILIPRKGSIFDKI